VKSLPQACREYSAMQRKRKQKRKRKRKEGMVVVMG
jgi:hypothetical protein